MGFIPTFYFIEKFPRKKAGLVFFLLTMVTSFGIVMIEKPKGCDLCAESIVELVLIFIFRLSIAV